MAALPHSSGCAVSSAHSRMADDAPVITSGQGEPAPLSSPGPLPPDEQPQPAVLSERTGQDSPLKQASPAPPAPDEAVTSNASSPRSTTPLISFPSASLLRTVDIAPDKSSAVSAASPFYKGVAWSPDGTCLLTAAEDHVMRLYEVQTLMRPTAAPPPPSPAPLSSSSASSELPVLTVGIGETVYDYAWFPRMHSSDAASCCFMTTARDLPCQLWDAFTGQLRCSYVGYDQADEPTSALSLCFSPDGERLYSGYDSAIRCFDTASPGRDCDVVPLVSSYLLPGSKRRRRDGQHGLISSLSTCASAPSLLAAGSYSGDAAVYDSSAAFLCTQFISCHSAGISSVSLHPPLLFVACRGETAGDDILCFDLRHSGAEVGRLQRVCRNNQRVEMEVREEGRWLLTGSQDGCVVAFDLSLPSDAETGRVPPACVVKVAAGDATGGGGVVNGVAMHPLWSQQYPYFAAVTGSRVFDAYEAEQDDSDDDDDDDDAGQRQQGGVTRSHKGADASLSLWQVMSRQLSDTG